jgi:DNA-binding MarR family transcriptional regulator
MSQGTVDLDGASDTGARHRVRRLLQRAELAAGYQRAARARQLGMHQVELAALEHLVVTGGLTPGELGHRLGLTSGGVTALAGRLVGAALVSRSPHPTDRRMRVLTVTPEGEARVADFMAPVEAPLGRVLSWLSEEDIEVLERFFDPLVLLRERAAAATPGPRLASSGDGRTHALLM